MIGPGNGVAAVIPTASLGYGLDAVLRATNERCTQPRERCDDRKRRMFTAYGQPPDHAHFSAEIQRSTDDNLWNRASPAMLRVAKPSQSYIQATVYEQEVRIILTANLPGSQGFCRVRREDQAVWPPASRQHGDQVLLMTRARCLRRVRSLRGAQNAHSEGRCLSSLRSLRPPSSLANK